jgi:hypothetical protein
MPGFMLGALKEIVSEQVLGHANTAPDLTDEMARAVEDAEALDQIEAAYAGLWSTDAVLPRRRKLQTEGIWKLCRMAYQHRADAERIAETNERGRLRDESLVSKLCELLEEDVDFALTEAACALLHTLCVVDGFVHVLGDVGTTRLIAGLFAKNAAGKDTAERIMTDICGGCTPREMHPGT